MSQSRVLGRFLLSFAVFVALSLLSSVAADWEVLLGGTKVPHLESFEGDVYAGTEHGLFVKSPEEEDGHWDAFFANTPVQGILRTPVYRRSAKTSDLATILVIGNNTLYQSSANAVDWKPIFPDKKVVAIHGNRNYVVFLAEIFGDDGKPQRTRQSEVWIAGAYDIASAKKVAAFAATEVFVAANGDVYTYGDVHGPYGGTVGVSSDGGATWRHSRPQAALKGGKVFAFGEAVFVSSSIGGLMRSYDKGRTFAHITHWKGLPEWSLSCILVFGKSVFVGTEQNGLFVSLDEGDSWPYHASKGQRNFPSNSVLSLALDPISADVYAGTDVGLVVKRKDDASERAAVLEPNSWWLKGSPKMTF